ncbi:MAG: porin family protein [Bdellovibrionales bacterium]|nr:porin family protein [Bdellovibrionales bacterium]
MKLKTENKRLTFMSLFLATALVAVSGHSVKALAQDDVLDDAEDALSSDTLEMDQIEIEGKLSPSELLKRRREKLEERNKIMVEKKIENIRVKQEIALTNKLQGAFNNSLNNLNEDKVQVVQAAPAPVVAPAPVAPAPVIETRIIEVPAPVVKVDKKSKIIPSLGMTSISGDRVDLETDLTLGVSAETMIAPQFSMGIALGYSTMKLTDVSNEYLNSGTVNTGGYNAVYGSGREMDLKKVTLEGNAKYFFIEDAMIKPYIGGAVSFNRTTLKYKNSSSYNVNGYSYGNEDFGSSSVAGAAKLGAEVGFNDTIGANLEFGYVKNISSGISKSSEVSTTTSPDQGRLENVSKEIEDASATTIQAGLVIKF